MRKSALKIEDKLFFFDVFALVPETMVPFDFSCVQTVVQRIKEAVYNV